MDPLISETTVRNHSVLAPLSERRRFEASPEARATRNQREVERARRELDALSPSPIPPAKRAEFSDKMAACEAAALDAGADGKELFQAVRRFREKHGIMSTR